MFWIHVLRKPLDTAREQEIERLRQQFRKIRKNSNSSSKETAPWQQDSSLKPALIVTGLSEQDANKAWSSLHPSRVWFGRESGPRFPSVRAVPIALGCGPGELEF